MMDDFTQPVKLASTRAALIFTLVALIVGLAWPTLASAAGSSSTAGRSVRADFNGDGRSDLAVGVPFEDFASGKINDGAVNVIYGTGAGLASPGNQVWGQDSPGIAGVAESGDQFGLSLTAAKE